MITTILILVLLLGVALAFPKGREFAIAIGTCIAGFLALVLIIIAALLPYIVILLLILICWHFGAKYW